jgi:hypothetical protein
MVGSAVVHFEICAAASAPLVAFYQQLFGWELQPRPGGYTAIDTRGGTGINGGIRPSPFGIQSPAGTQSPVGTPGTAFYVETDDLQATLDRATALGGTIAVPATDFGPGGHRAMVADPDGLPVGLVHWVGGHGADAAPGGNEQGPSEGPAAPVTWFEVMGADATRTQQFYADLFGWEIDHSFPAYAAVDTHAEHGIAGGLGGGTPARWATVYAKVDDTEQTLRRVAELGGSPITDPSVPTLKAEARAALYGSAGAMTTGAFRDPAGNVFGVFDYGSG